MKAILTTLAVFVAPLASPVALAQSDGTLGSSSTGTLNFNVNISDANRIQIFGFKDMVQTVEAGQTGLQDRSQFDTGASSRGIPCITADLPGTTVALDWSVTPLSDGTNIVPVRFITWKNVKFPTGVGGTQILDIQPDELVTTQTGSISGVETKTGENGTCRSNDSIGRLQTKFLHTGRAYFVENPGTYVSTITFTVKPE